MSRWILIVGVSAMIGACAESDDPSRVVYDTSSGQPIIRIGNTTIDSDAFGELTQRVKAASPEQRAKMQITAPADATWVQVEAIVQSVADGGVEAATLVVVDTTGAPVSDPVTIAFPRTLWSSDKPPAQPIKIALRPLSEVEYTISLEGIPSPPASLAELRAILSAMKLTDSNRAGIYFPTDPVIVRPDDTIQWEAVIDTIRTAQSAGYENVFLGKVSEPRIELNSSDLPLIE